MSRSIDKEMNLVIVVVVILLISAAFTGCVEDDDEMFELNVGTDGEGTVDIEPEQDEYEEGTEVTLTANPDEDWGFVEWTGTDETGEEITISMDEDKTITAVFEEDVVVDTYILTVNIDGEGTVDIDPDQDEYEEGTDVTLTAYPDDGWEFDGWTGDETGTETTITFEMDEDKTITAVFEEDVVQDTYTLTVDTDGEGTVDIDPEQDEYEEGTDVTLTAYPDEGWEFDGWTGDETGTETTITFEMDEDKTITAVFEEDVVEETYWNAYDFESEVEISDNDIQSLLGDNDGSESKTLQEWTYEHTFVEDGAEKNFVIETTYEGISTTEITVVRYEIDGFSYSEEEKTVEIQTYVLEHNISVDIEGDDTHPDWIDMTVHIPVGDFSTEEVDTSDYDDFVDIPDTSNFWIYSLVEFSDSKGNQGLFSYHLTEEWIEEMNQDDDIFYVPYVEDDFDETDYDEWVLYGIYGHCWTWFQPFSEDTPITEGTHSIGGFEFYVENTIVDLSGYEFDGFHIGSNDVTFGDDDVHLKGTFVPSLPVPVYLRAGLEDGDTSYTMQLTDIVFG